MEHIFASLNTKDMQTTINKNGSTSEFETSKKFKIITFNDDQCSCDVCGKAELKGTYLMENLVSGELFRAGSSCGAKMAGWTTKELVAKYKAGEKEKITQAKRELRESAEYIAYEAAGEFLQKENDLLNAKIYNEREQVKRDELSSLRRDMRSRLDFLRPTIEALKAKRDEINLKFGFKSDYYL